MCVSFGTEDITHTPSLRTMYISAWIEDTKG
jgi:hypothetical protein